MTKSNKVNRFSDLIGDNYKRWEKEYVVLDGGTDTGKTYFITEILGMHAKSNAKKIIYLCNRTELREQVWRDIKRLNLTETIYITTYQSLENKIKNKKQLNYYDYIVSDECHYFTNDALFNDYTDLSYSFVKSKRKESVVIYMSATAKVFFRWLKTKMKLMNRIITQFLNLMIMLINYIFMTKSF